MKQEEPGRHTVGVKCLPMQTDKPAPPAELIEIMVKLLEAEKYKESVLNVLENRWGEKNLFELVRKLNLILSIVGLHVAQDRTSRLVLSCSVVAVVSRRQNAEIIRMRIRGCIHITLSRRFWQRNSSDGSLASIFPCKRNTAISTHITSETMSCHSRLFI